MMPESMIDRAVYEIVKRERQAATDRAVDVLERVVVWLRGTEDSEPIAHETIARWVEAEIRKMRGAQ